MRGMKKGGLQEEYIKMAYAFSKKFKDDSNILGITLNGGVARGTGDEFSEIDLHFYVKNKKSKKQVWLRITDNRKKKKDHGNSSGKKKERNEPKDTNHT